MREYMDINTLILILVNGALFIMAVYHSMVYSYHRPILLKQYIIYLWLVWIYCLYRLLMLQIVDPFDYRNLIYLDEILQMLAFLQYVRFLGYAMQLNLNQPTLEANFVKYTPWVIMVYLVLLNVADLVLNSLVLYIGLKLAVRIFLMVGGFSVLILVLRQKPNLYYKLIGAGSVSLIAFGLLSTFSKYASETPIFITPLSLLLIGFLVDVIFFSSAVGYTIKQEVVNQEKAYITILQKEQELANEKLEKVKIVYETKEIERQRIANDLHDDLGGTMSSLMIYGSIAKNTMTDKPEYARKMIDKLVDLSQLAMDNLSDIIWSMKYNIGTNSLKDRVKNYGIERLQDLNIAIEYDIHEQAEEMLSNTLERKNVILFTKEAINNIAKYSGATKAWVSIYLENEILYIEIGDNGRGFNLDTVTKGNGLETMEYRMKELGGETIIKSTEGGGTKINAHFPVRIIES